MDPVWQNPIHRIVRTSHLSVLITVHTRNCCTQQDTVQFWLSSLLTNKQRPHQWPTIVTDTVRTCPHVGPRDLVLAGGREREEGKEVQIPYAKGYFWGGHVPAHCKVQKCGLLPITSDTCLLLQPSIQQQVTVLTRPVAKRTELSSS